MDSVVLVDEPTLIGEEYGGTHGASSTVTAPAKATKKGRNLLSPESEPSASMTDDEGSATSSGIRQRKKRGRPRTTNIVDVIREKEREREEYRKKEREEWEERRMADPNLIIAPATNLPSLDEVVEDMENQPTPDVTAEIMQVVRTIEKVATTAKNLNGQYVRRLRSAAFKVHAGLNVLSHRSQVEKDDAGEVASLRRKIRSMRLEKERVEKELKEVSIHKEEVEENKDLKRRVRSLEDDLQDMRVRIATEVEGGDRRVGGSSMPSFPARAPPSAHLSPTRGERRESMPPAGSGGRTASSPPAGSTREELGSSLQLLRQIEWAIDRIVEQVVGRINMGSITTPQTPMVEKLVDLDCILAPEAPIIGASGAGGCRGPPTKRGKKRRRRRDRRPLLGVLWACDGDGDGAGGEEEQRGGASPYVGISGGEKK